MLRVFVYCIITMLTGYLCADRLLPPSRTGLIPCFLKASIGIGFGFGLTSCSVFLVLCLCGPSPFMVVAADACLLVCLAALFLVKQKAYNLSLIPDMFPGHLQSHRMSRILLWSLVAVLCSAVFLFVIIAATLPHGYSDAWGIWNLRARYLFKGGENWTAVFSRLIRHADYPYLVSASVFRGWLYAGNTTPLIPVAMAFLFTFGIPGLLMSSLALVRTISQGCIAALLTVGMPYFITQGAGQYADAPHAFFILTTIIFYYLYEMSGSANRFVVLAGISTGFACWTKNEGLLFLCALVAARCISVTFAKSVKTFLKEIAFFLAGIVPFLTLLVVFKMQVPPDNLIYGGCKKIFLHPEILLDIQRYWFIGKNFFSYGLFFHNFIITPLPVLLLYLLCMGVEIKNKDKYFLIFAGLCLMFVVAGYFFIYVITPYNLDWHIRTSINRLLLHLWPAFLFCFFLIIQPPEQLLIRFDRSPLRWKKHKTCAGG